MAKKKTIAFKNLIRNPLIWLLLATLIHGLWYAFIVHPWQAPDEYLHYEYMRLIDSERTLSLTAENRSSEMQWEIAESMWRFQHYRYRLIPTSSEEFFRSIQLPIGSRVFSPQPPLYYLVSLPIYWGIQSFSVDTQLYVLRVFSVILQVTTVLLTYALAREILTGEKNRNFCLIAGGVVAFLPQYSFISASYNNDNLVPPLITASLLALIKAFKESGSFRWLSLSFILGLLSIATKRTAIAILPVLGIGTIIVPILAIQTKSRIRRMISVALLTIIAIIFSAGISALFLRPQLPSELAKFLRLSTNSLDVLSSFWSDPNLLTNIDWRWLFDITFESFWGQFGWLTIRLDPVWISILRWISFFSILGVGIGLWKTVTETQTINRWFITFFLCLLILGIILTLFVTIAQYLINPIWYPPQGRYFFPFIANFGILFTLGVQAWFRSRYRKYALILTIVIVLLIDALGWFTILRTYYS